MKKGLMLVSVFSLLLLIFSPLNTMAEEKADEKISYYFAEPNDNYEINFKLDEIITKNYWSNLKKVDVTDKETDKNGTGDFKFKIAIPNYLLDPDQTSIHEFATHKDWGGYLGLEFFSFGIIPEWSAFNIMHPLTLNSEYGMGYMSQYCVLPSDTNKNFKANINQFNFTQNDILTEEEVKDPVNKLKVLGDLKKKDSKDSKKIDELNVNEEFELDFSMKAPWFKRLYNSYAMSKLQIGGISEDGAKKIHDQFVKSDSQIVFTLDIPDGVKVDTTKLQAIFVDKNDTTQSTDIKKIKDLFSINAEIKNEKEGEKTKQVVVVTLRKNAENNKNVKKWQDFVDLIKKVDTENLLVRIKGLSVKEDAKANENITINATASAMYDFATSETEKFYLNDDRHNTLFNVKGQGWENSSERHYWTFAAVQDPAGLDEATPKDKPNLISYTFKVKAGEVTPTPTPEPEPEPTPIPEPEVTPPLKTHEYVETHPVITVVDKKGDKKEVVNSHDKYIFGYPDDTIRPDGDMTRAEAISVVARLQKLDLSDKSSKIYKDAKADMWYNGAINAAYREGYLLEKEGESIRPNDKITRAELAELISHIDKKNNSLAPFEDVKGHKFEAAINQAYGNERIKGYPDGTFKPDNTITRAEVATMLNKLYDRYPDKNFIDAKQNLVHNYKDMPYKGHWGYYELVEAYHSHTYLRLKDNMEEWKEIIK
ncbi:MAG: S-layer homology domain-containing protein [Peptoniphilus harei]|nr:S-layer homology domain-containing protein [Peptoniphilus harei]